MMKHTSLLLLCLFILLTGCSNSKEEIVIQENGNETQKEIQENPIEDNEQAASGSIDQKPEVIAYKPMTNTGSKTSTASYLTPVGDSFFGQNRYYVDNNNYALVKKNEDGSEYIEYNEKTTPSYSSIVAVTMSPEGDIVYIAKLDNGNESIFLNEDQSPEYKAVGYLGSTAFHDGTFVYLAQKDNDKRVLVEDGEVTTEDRANIEGVSSDYFLGTKDNGNQVVVINGKESNEYKHIYTNSRYINKTTGEQGFVAQTLDEKMVWVQNGIEISEKYEFINGRDKVCSHNCEHILMTASKSNGLRIVLKNGKEYSREYEVNRDSGREIGFLTISENGESVAFSTKKKDDTYAVVFNGEESKTYPYVTDIHLSADGKNIIHQIRNSKAKRNTYSIVYNGVKQAEYASIDSRRPFEPNGYVYTATKQDGTHVFVVNGKESPTYNGVSYSISDMEKTKVMRIGTRLDKKMEVLINSQAYSDAYVSIDNWTISENGKIISFIGQNDDTYSLVINNIASTPHTKILGYKIYQDENGKIHYRYLAQDQENYLVVTDGKKTDLQYIETTRPIMHKNGDFSFIGTRTDGKKVFVKNFLESDPFDEITSLDDLQRPSSAFKGKNILGDGESEEYLGVLGI